jgi:fructoselysine 6-kinase
MIESYDVVCVGDNCLDTYLPLIGRCFVGGSAVNVAVHLRLAGLPSAYVGAVGSDEPGEQVLAKLISAGLDVTHVDVIPGATSRSFIRLGPAGEREFDHTLKQPNVALALDDEKIDFINRHRLAHFTWLGGVENSLPVVHEKGAALISFVFGERWSETTIAAHIGQVDLAFFSLPEDRAQDAECLAQRWFEAGPRLVVVTLGQRGSLAYDGTFYRQPARPAQVVDTLGAGDTFIGHFLAGWLKGSSLPVCLENGADAAALTCGHFGAWPGAETPLFPWN